jgi:hypothetical protein
VSISPPIAIAIAAVDLFTSIGAAVINGYNDQATQDEIAKAVYCQLRTQNITTADGMAQVLDGAFANDVNKAAWFANMARLLGDDLTTRILGIGAQEPSNVCALYECDDTYDNPICYDFCDLSGMVVIFNNLTKQGCNWSAGSTEGGIRIQLPFVGTWRVSSSQNHTYSKFLLAANGAVLYDGQGATTPFRNNVAAFQWNLPPNGSASNVILCLEWQA